MIKEVKRQTLFYNDGVKSDKVYDIRLMRLDDNKYQVWYAFGRRGSKLQTGIRDDRKKTSGPLYWAEAVFEKLSASKTKKGYAEKADVVYVGPKAEVISGPSDFGDGSRWDEI